MPSSPPLPAAEENEFRPGLGTASMQHRPRGPDAWKVRHPFGCCSSGETLWRVC